MKNSKLIIATLIIFMLGIASCGNSQSPSKEPEQQKTPKSQAVAVEVEGKVINMDKQMFIDKVFDYTTNGNEWVYKGDKPCIIDFYADWCRPCKMIAPIMEELAETYKGQIVIYKVDTDVQRELAGSLGIRNLPSVLYCPMQGNPQMSQGALPKEQFEAIVKDFLLNNN